VVPTVRRTLASLAAWTAGASVAVGVGVLALSLIDNGLASGAVQPVPIDGPIVAAPPSPTPPASPSAPSGEVAPVPSDRPSPSQAPTAGPLRQLASTGGTAIARCTQDGLAYLVSWSPAQGYEADDVRRGPNRVVSVTFAADAQRVWLGIHCVAGIPERVPGDHHDQ
jgi:hypothetical protein